ncbi:MAG: hypothetical protein ABH950_09415 [Candidatus Altiarchaeota archaeon]
MKKKIKALGLLSGGLDSMLSCKLIQGQGIEVEAVHFVLPFYTLEEAKQGRAAKASEYLKVKLHYLPMGSDYIEVLRNPKHGYGKNINPCIDCRAYYLRKAKGLAEEVGADFIFTGEVLGQRPMSQHKRAMSTVEEEAGLAGKLLRPLSAQILPETEAEKNGWVDRAKLKGFSGRSRKPQMALVKELGIKDYAQPAGGCPLTQKDFSIKVRDLFEHKKEITENDLLLLSVGRHFRVGGSKIVVGRDEEENAKIMSLAQGKDILLEVRDDVGPTTLVMGPGGVEAIKIAAALTLAYSDSDEEKSVVKIWGGVSTQEMTASAIAKDEIENFRLGSLIQKKQKS